MCVHFSWVNGVGGGIFCVSGGRWMFFMGGWGWKEVYFGWVGVDGGRWRYILGGWG